MAKEKTFTIGGQSTLKGRKTLRLANGKAGVRKSVLKQNGHTDIELVELPRPMIKADAYAWLTKQGYKGVIPAPVAEAKPKQKKPAVKKAVKKAAKKAAPKKTKAATPTENGEGNNGEGSGEPAKTAVTA